ncbi:MAG TPA: pyrimidine reductase family protein [Acidimicrobiales bacterium]|jgi:5-amino-6-(5-phosphoribosylamino)uracil reductase
MRQLFPVLDPASGGGDVDPAAPYAAAVRPAPPGRPWVLLNMVASVDGATAVKGRSGGLGGPSDKVVFSAIRAVADVIIAGNGTVRAEGYGPPRPSAATQEARVARGQAPFPRIAVVSGSLDLDLHSSLFTTPEHRPLVITTEDPPADRLAAAAERADVVQAGHGPVDLGAALGLLAAAGHRVALVEGGPTLNGQLVAADLVDELCLTVSPHFVGGTSGRVAHGPDAALEALELAHVLHDPVDGLLFLRYVRVG